MAGTSTLPARRALRRLDGGDRGSGTVTPLRAVAQFGAAALVVLALCVVGGALASRQAARTEAVADARRATEILARGVVAPNLTDGLLRGDPAAIARLDTAVRRGVLPSGILRAKVWSPDGRILYSDERRLIGTRFNLDEHERAAIRDGRAAAEVSDLDGPENRFERGFGTLLEVYLPVRTPNGTTLLFETYSPYREVTERSRTIWREFVPITLGLLVLLQLVQLPLAASLARRLERSRAEREALLRNAIVASDAERRRIASDLHDGVVQDLAGVSYALVGAADQIARAGQPQVASAVYDAAGGVRHSMRALRSLLVEIYPPNLRTAGLPAALGDLVAPLSRRGIEVELAMPPALRLPDDVEALIFRVAQEAVRNAAQHARPERICIRLETWRERAVLTVEDDGAGFDVDATVGRPAEGHVGLVLLADLARDAGALLEIDSAPEDGTRVRLEVALP